MLSKSHNCICYCICHWAHCGIFETGVLLRYTLEGENSVANFIMKSLQ